MWIFQSLRSRLVVMLSLAILPLGLISVQQSVQVLRDARVLEEQEILARTLSAATDEQELLRRTFGSAFALGIAAVEVGPASDMCDQIMARAVEATTDFVFAGFMTPDGVLRCASSGSEIDFSQTTLWREFSTHPREMINLNRQGAVTGQSVVIATVPVVDDISGELLGAMSVSVPHSIADYLLSIGSEGVDMALIARDGRVLAFSDGIESADVVGGYGLFPSDMEITGDGATRTVTGPNGEERLAALVPLLNGDIYLVGLWNSEVARFNALEFSHAAPLFPILMWIAALVVSLLALDRLVLRHLRSLRHRMIGFSVDRPTNSFVQLEDAPAEFAQIADTYNRMVDRILADRTELEQNLAEKELLIREVHHRVKNNLQLIASILNMQIRGIGDPREQRLLRRVQDRVMSLSVVHRILYDDSHVGPVRADRMLTEVVEATLAGGLQSRGKVRTRVAAEEVMLDADQAVPLALLANEAVTNAIKYVGRPMTGRAEIVVTLGTLPDGSVELKVSNTTGPNVNTSPDIEPSGLGSRLIEAFAAQLDAELSTHRTADLHELALRFRSIEEDPPNSASDTGMSFFGSVAHRKLAGGRSDG